MGWNPALKRMLPAPATVPPPQDGEQRGNEERIVLPTGEAGQAICEVCLGGSTEKAFPQTRVGNQGSRQGGDRTVLVWKDGCLSATKLNSCCFREAQPLPFLREA